VRNHVSNILLKLQMANRIEAAAYAIKNDVV
jgi:DNA-binding NarL/FixJ family response regulator